MALSQGGWWIASTLGFVRWDVVVDNMRTVTTRRADREQPNPTNKVGSRQPEGDGSTSDQTGDLHLPWFQALSDENAPRNDQRRPNGEHRSPRALPAAAARLAAGNRHLDVHKQQALLRLALNGYYQYFGVRLAKQAL